MANSLVFAADNSEVRFLCPPAVDLVSYFTIAVLHRRTAVSDSAARTLIAHHNSSGSSGVGFPYISYYYDAIEQQTELFELSGSLFSCALAQNATDWYLTVFTRNEGSSVEFHQKNLSGGSWQHTQEINFGSISSCSDGTIRLGEMEDFNDLEGYISVVGGWDVHMSNAQVEALLTNLRTSDWSNHAAASPKYLWELTSKTSIPDLMGNGATLQVVNGTVESAAGPSGWTYGVGPPTAPPSQSLSIVNTGLGTLNWSVTKTQAWLTISPTSGSSSGETDNISVSVDPTGLSPGVYNDTITITAAGSSNSPQTVPITFNVTAGTDTTPPTPNVTVTTATRMSRVAGKDSSDVTFTSNEAFVEYQIRKVASTTDSVTQGTLIETATVTSRTSHTVTITDDEIVAAEGSVIPGDKLIKIFVRDAAGNWSA